MSKIQGKPFIELVVDTLGDLKADFLDLVNGSDKTPEFRSLITASAKITGSDKGKVQYVVLETWSKTYTGYLIYNNTYCVLVAFSSNTQALTMLKINVAKQTFETVKEYLDINELRRYLEEASEHITSGEIDSGEAQQGDVLYADGEGGAEWGNLTDAIKEDSVDDGDVVQIFGFDSEGNLVKDNMPEGIVVDDALNTESDNAIANKPVAEKFEEVDEALENKANVDGNYPTMTVGMADNLTPYDESAGDDQDTPFSFQATGTGNGTQPDFSTGSSGLMKEKQGNTVVVNQYCDRTTDLVGTAGATIYTSIGTAFVQNPIPVGHKVLIFYKQNTTINEATRNTVGLRINTGEETYDYQWISQVQNRNLTAGNYYELVTTTYPVVNFAYWVQGYGDGDISFSDFKGIDLTQWFNGDIPQDILDNPSNFFRYYQGSLSYNEGTLVNANGRYIKCIGMNQWDEEYYGGGYINNDGTVDTSGHGNTILSKNFIEVIPNTVIYFKMPYNVTSYGYRLAWYDKDYNLIARGDRYVATANVPSNACFMKFNTSTQYGSTTYNNDISINLYYADEPRCLTYEPYQVLTNNDTGNEQLLAFDYKTPDGVWHKNTKKVLDLSSLSWTYSSTYNAWYSDSVNDIKEDAKYIANNYVKVDYTDIIGSGASAIGIWINTTASRIWIRNGSSTTQPSGELQYETNAPTTEQGTPYSENLVIDDFGSMDFGSDVPQGALIFYPVDYKAFVDTLYKYTDGTPSNIALKSDVSSEQSARESVDTQLLNAVGGTLRQCLCVKESLDFDNTDFVDLGDYNYQVQSGIQGLWAMSSQLNVKQVAVGEKANVLSTIYQTQTANDLYAGTKGIGFNINIWIYDNSVSTREQLKEKLKGVLLAYEKASE